jgi:AcrR family transcriptional regulator
MVETFSIGERIKPEMEGLMDQADTRETAKETEAHEIKKKIIEAAGRLYEQKGLYETSVAEIAEAAGISTPVTYHYVNRKSDIMLLIMEDFTDRIKARVPEEVDGLENPAQKLARTMELYFRLFDKEMVKLILVYRESRTLDKAGRKRIMAAETEHVRILEEILQEGIDSGDFRQVEDIKMVAYNILMAGHTWALKNWHFKKRMGLEEYTRIQTSFFLNALTTNS